MDNNNSSNLGDQIENIVQDAVNKMDFDKLNRNIGNTVNSALAEVQSHLRESQQRRTSGYYQQTRTQAQYKENMQQQVNARAIDRDMRAPRAPRPARMPRPQQLRPQKPNHMMQQHSKMPMLIRPTGGDKVGGILLAAFGTLGAVGMGTGLFGMLMYAMFEGAMWAGEFIGIAFMGIFFLLFLLLGRKGYRTIGRLNRLKDYLRVIRGRSYITIKELANSVQRSEKYIIKDLRFMIRNRVFLEGRLDDEGTCLMLTNEVYEQYVIAKDTQRQKQIQELSGSQKQIEPAEGGNALDDEIKRVIGEGQDCINKIRIANNAIPGEEISMKLERLENVISKIFSHVEAHPDQISDIRKFMEYYLPTTLKLVDTYQQLEAQPVQRDNIKSAKEEIEQTLDTINNAFENLLDSLFKDVAMDVSTDITVLQAMLAQEGLTEKDFK